MEHSAKLVHEARACVSAVKESLREPTPANLTLSWPLLQQAIDHLGSLQGWLKECGQRPHAELVHSALELRREVTQLSALLESSGGFVLGWTHRLGAMVSGYTQQGVPRPLSASRHVSLEG